MFFLKKWEKHVILATFFYVWLLAKRKNKCKQRCDVAKKGTGIAMEIFAHRGASGYAPENTILAFTLAYEQGADGIELDVQMTKEGEVVVVHDETIDRVSTGKGFVGSYTLEELRRFSFHNQMQEYEGHAEIPTLREVLKLVKPWGMKVNIELKTGIYWYPGIEEKTAGMVKEEKMEEAVIFSSFNHYSIRKIREIMPDVETAYLFGDIILDVQGYVERCRAEGLHIPLYQAKMQSIMKEYQRCGLPVRVWTVDEEEDLELLNRAGAAGVFTNRPDVAVKVRRENTVAV